MQTFQTRQIIGIIKTKFPLENSIFNVTVHGKQNGSSVLWSFFCCCVEQTAS